MTPEQIAKHTSLHRQLRDAKAQIVALEMRVKAARDQIAEVLWEHLHDGSNGRSLELAEDAILTLIQRTPTDTPRSDAATEE